MRNFCRGIATLALLSLMLVPMAHAQRGVRHEALAYKPFIVNGVSNADSTQRSSLKAAGADAGTLDTLASIAIRSLQPKFMQPLPVAADSTALLSLRIVFTGGAAADTVRAQVQYSQDGGTTWTTSRTYTNDQTGWAAPIRVYAWKNATGAAYDLATHVRVILDDYDTSGKVKQFQVEQIVFGPGRI